MKYRCIDRRRVSYAVRMMCRLLNVSSSGYYAWRTRPESVRGRENRKLTVEIRAIHAESDGIYGSPKILDELRDRGYSCGRHRVARLMRLEGLRGIPKRRFRRTTNSDHGNPVAPNVLEQNFTANAQDERWAADITYIRTGEGWLYLAVVLDLYSRRVVGWSMSTRLTRDLVLDAVTMAVWRRAPKADLIHHSDRGCQYTSDDFRTLLKSHGIRCSMSGTGNCFDNAVVESFFGLLKRERVYRRKYRTREQARADIFDYIEVFYNRKRRHSYLGSRSPAEFEKLETRA